ncbi:Lipoprotein [Caenorhabditis elegans]|nr:Lipoprotein [Caenorhabditis elegans]CCD83498.1 Lipoprotein [Caenorhabditis elegans]|eukprot:NP_001023487.1 Uncharacterized protein CELE_Y54G2A.10 [Caenorhabditis elegans]
MKKVFWAADVKAANNYTMTCGQFMMDAASLVKDSDKLMAEVQKNTNLFAKANPTDFTNLQWNL